MPPIGLRMKVREKIKDLVLPRERKIKHTRINGYDLLVPVNEGLGWSAYYLKRYDWAETNFLKQVVRKDWICFDVGANVGYYSLLFSSLAPQGSIHSFEPVPLHQHLFGTSVLLNHFKNITINHCAVGSNAGSSDFFVPRQTGNSSFVDIQMGPLEQMITVPVRTLDDYIKENSIQKIDIVKIDVEGAEKLVLDGFRETLSRKELRPGILFVELYDPACVYYGTSIDETVNFLRTCGYEAFIIPRKRLVPFVKEHYNVWYNIFFISPEEKLRCGWN